MLRVRLVVRPKFPHQHAGIVGGLLNYTCRDGRESIWWFIPIVALPQSAPAAAPWALSGAEEGTAGVGGQVSPFPLLSSRGVERVPGPEALASLPAVEAQLLERTGSPRCSRIGNFSNTSLMPRLPGETTCLSCFNGWSDSYSSSLFSHNGIRMIC